MKPGEVFNPRFKGGRVMRIHCVIRDDQEVYVRRDCLTVAELADVETREKSPLARRRFGALLRRVRRAEDAPVKAALKAATDPNVSAEEKARLLSVAIESFRILPQIGGVDA